MAPSTKYSEFEKSLLIELVDKYKGIIESKKCDAKSIKIKSNHWDIIAGEYNANSQVTKRDASKLKKCWENMKSRAKKNVAKKRRSSLATGGGPQETHVDASDEATVAITSIVPDQMDPLSNPYDNDNLSEPEINELQPNGSEHDAEKLLDTSESSVTLSSGSAVTPATTLSTTALTKPATIPAAPTISSATVQSERVKKTLEKHSFYGKVTEAQKRALGMQEREHKLRVKLLKRQLQKC